tara:strand:- start:98394 stop:98576 length:183 start_codon:yes stop_codon:yes gene_type:complete
MPSKQQIKRDKAAAHNEAYEAERQRLSKLTPDERRKELIRQGVEAGIKAIKPQVDDLLGK